MDPDDAARIKQIEERTDQLMGLVQELNNIALSLRGRLDVAAIMQVAAFRSLGELVPGFSQKFGQLCSGHRKTLTDLAARSDEALREEIEGLLEPD